MIATRRRLLIGAGAMAVAGPAAARSELSLTGRLVQGGFALGRTWPAAAVFLDGEALTTASPEGLFVIGFDRDAGGSVEIGVRSGALNARRVLNIARGDFVEQRIDGLPPSTVAPPPPALLARIQREAALKAEAYASRDPATGFTSGFDWPLERYRISSRWGSRRILNGTPARPHYGIDLAAPAGTVIRAPADGVVTLAERELHYEGGTTFIDHGQGLISVYLHQSRLDVQAGQRVRRGEAIGRVGATGRATGPHLCWRMRWRDRNLDPSLMVGASAPVAG